MKKKNCSRMCHKQQSHCGISCLFTLTDPTYRSLPEIAVGLKLVTMLGHPLASLDTKPNMT